MSFTITQDPIDADAVYRAVATPAEGSNPDGAVIVFHGTVRNKTADRTVRYLEYECYEPMALKQLRRVAAEVIQQHEISTIACTHRVGRLEIGEDAMVVAVASPHRGAALAATEAFIARLKQEVPIWKKEHFEGGAVWIGTPEDPQGASVAIREGDSQS